MRKPEAETIFRLLHGDTLRGMGKDYGKREELWAIYIDNLCKSREITPTQFANWTTPTWIDPR